MKNGGEIINAVASQKWSGEAAVNVSIVSWKKGKFTDEKILYYFEDKELNSVKQETINSSLSLKVDVTSAQVLNCNRKPKQVFQGQTHGHEGFLINRSEALKMLSKDSKYTEVLKPFLIGDELVAAQNSQPSRFVIDFTLLDVIKASTYKEVFKKIEEDVLPDRRQKAEDQEKENKETLSSSPKAKVNKHHINFLNKWWKLSYGREDMLEAVADLPRYIACSRVTQRPIFEFIDSKINANDALMVFAFADYYSFGIINSKLHWDWFVEKCSTLGGTFRYTADTVWDTFPWPQNPTQKQIENVGQAALSLHESRIKSLREHNMSLRDLYRVIEQPGKNSIRDLQDTLDKAVLEAYGFDGSDQLTQLLQLNLQVSDKENRNEKVQTPGLPEWTNNKERLITNDSVKFEK